MASGKYLKLRFSKRIREASVEITEYFTPYTYEALTKEQEYKGEESFAVDERNNLQALKILLKAFNIVTHSEINEVDCYYDGEINEIDWRSNPDNLGYTYIFDYWSEVHIVSTMANMELTDDRILNVVTQELKSKAFISELKKDVSILLRFDKDNNAWNSSVYESRFPDTILNKYVDHIKYFFAESEGKSGEELRRTIYSFLREIENGRYIEISDKLYNDIKRVCKAEGESADEIKSQIIILLKQYLAINFNEAAFKIRKDFLFKLKRDYNLTKYSAEEFREFAYFPEKLLANLTRIIIDIQDRFNDFENLQSYFDVIEQGMFSWYYGENSSRCFAIMKKDTQGYFALSGVYDYPNSTYKIKSNDTLRSYEKMRILADDINVKVFNSEYTWAPLIDDVLTYYSHENLDLSKLENAKILDNPESLKYYKSTYGWQKVTHRLFSCCEKKLLAQLNNKTYSSLEFFIRYTPCHLCMKPMFEIVKKGKTKVYSLADSFKELKYSKGLKDITRYIRCCYYCPARVLCPKL